MADSKQKDDPWAKRAEIRRDKFKDLLERDDGKLLDWKFMEALVANKHRLEARQEKRQIVLATLTLFLLIALVVPDAHLSFLGTGFEAKQMREFLLLIWAVVSSTSFFGFADSITIREILEAFVRSRAANDETLGEALRVRFGLAGSSLIPTLKPGDVSGRRALFAFLFAIFFLAWVRVTLAGMILVRLVGVISILWDPSFSRWLSAAIAIYLIIVAVVIMGHSTLSGSYAKYPPKVST
jgi:hypothetical protein